MSLPAYQKLEVIGEGTFSSVYKAQLVDSGEIVAIKEASDSERYILSKLQNENIIHIIHTDKNNAEIMLLYMPCSLLDLLQEGPLDWIDVKILGFQLFRGLAYLKAQEVNLPCFRLHHIHEIIHRDLKSSNILIDGPILKISDFGNATHPKDSMTCNVCSRYYKAPELLLNAKTYDFSIDIWAAGCIFAEMKLGEIFLRGGSDYDQLVQILAVFGSPSNENLRSMNLKQPITIPEIPALGVAHRMKSVEENKPYLDFLTNLLRYNPDERNTGFVWANGLLFENSIPRFFEDVMHYVDNNKSMAFLSEAFSSQDVMMEDQENGSSKKRNDSHFGKLCC